MSIYKVTGKLVVEIAIDEVVESFSASAALEIVDLVRKKYEEMIGVDENGLNKMKVIAKQLKFKRWKESTNEKAASVFPVPSVLGA
jgi:hypothetical protein